MEAVTTTRERTDHVRLELCQDGLWSAVPIETQGLDSGLTGRGETPSEALEDYRRRMEEEEELFTVAFRNWRRNGWTAFERRTA